MSKLRPEGESLRPTRRNVIKAMILSTAAISTPFIITPSRAAPKRIVVRDAGGLLSKAYAEVLYKPFTRATGIEVVGVTSEAEPISQVRTMVETKRYQWNMASLSQIAILTLATRGFLEKHELQHDPIISSILPQFISPHGVGAYVYATVVAYRTDAFMAAKLESWKDLWNTDHFPGRRSLRRLPFGTIEEALMADGVPLDKIYPCDLNRAFQRLDAIKSHIAAWWTSAPQAEQLLKSGEVDLMPTFSVRAQSAIEAGLPVAFSWDQHIYGCDSWAILKGAPNADLCRQFIQFASDPKRQAHFALRSIGPSQPDALTHIDLKYAKLLPVYPENLKKGLYLDAVYWAKHQQTAIERFNDWLIS